MMARVAAATAVVVVSISASASAAEESGAPAEKTESADHSEAPDAKKNEDASPKDTKEEKEAGEDDAYGHGMQFGLRAGVMLGGAMMFRYPQSPPCRDPSTDPNFAKGFGEYQKTCGFLTAPAVDVALSFAPLDSIEPYVFGRFGFSGQAQTNANPLFMFGAGARLYTMSDSRFKIFFEPAVAYQGEGGAGNPLYAPAEYKKDLVFHLGIGPQYDFAKAFGLYINSGLDVGVLRAISATLLLNIGVQLRMP